MTMTMDGNTHVSQPGGPQVQAATGPSSPGANGPGGQMSMKSAILWTIGGAVAISLGSAYLARKGKKPEIGHFDVIDSLFNASTVIVWIGTAKLVAYHFHGHKLSQAVLTIV